MSLKKFTHPKGLPGGPNENGFSVEGYRFNSPDRHNTYNIIDSGNISMEGVPHPVLGVDNEGNDQVMYPGYNYVFPGSQVFEVPILQQGGKVYSDKKNYDKALSAYNDSLQLYNAYQFQKNNIKTLSPQQYPSWASSTGKTKDDISRWNMASVKQRRTGPGSPDAASREEYREYWPDDPNGPRVIDYYNKLKFSDPVDIMYNSSPDLIHSKIKPIKSYFDGQGWSPVYKKPTTKPEYQPQTFEDDSVDTLPLLNARDVSLKDNQVIPVTPHQNINSQKEGDLVLPGSSTEWVKSPTGIWYQIERPVDGSTYNIYTGGTRMQNGGVQKSELGYREPITGETRPESQQEAFALFENQYGDVNYFADMYNALRNQTEQSYLENPFIVDEEGNLIPKTYDPDFLAKPYMSIKDSKQKARELNRRIRKEDLPYQKVRKDAFVNETGFTTVPSFQNGGYVDLDLTDEEILEFRRRGYKVEEI